MIDMQLIPVHPTIGHYFYCLLSLGLRCSYLSCDKVPLFSLLHRCCQWNISMSRVAVTVLDTSSRHANYRVVALLGMERGTFRIEL